MLPGEYSLITRVTTNFLVSFRIVDASKFFVRWSVVWLLNNSMRSHIDVIQNKDLYVSDGTNISFSALFELKQSTI